MGKLKQKAKTPNMGGGWKGGEKGQYKKNFKYLQQSKTIEETYTFADESYHSLALVASSPT